MTYDSDDNTFAALRRAYLNGRKDAGTELESLRKELAEIKARLLSRSDAAWLISCTSLSSDESRLDVAIERATIKPDECDHADRELPLPRCPRCGA